MKIIIKSCLIASLLMSSSCAYLFNSKTVDVGISSNPAGADIFIDGKNYGKTPMTLNIEPKNYSVVLTKEGYGSTKLNLEAWQAIRDKKGDGGRCLADALGTMLVLPLFSFWSVYCREFKQPNYSVNIPYAGVGNYSMEGRGNGAIPPQGNAVDDYYQQDMMKYRR